MGGYFVSSPLPEAVSPATAAFRRNAVNCINICKDPRIPRSDLPAHAFRMCREGLRLVGSCPRRARRVPALAAPPGFLEDMAMLEEEQRQEDSRLQLLTEQIITAERS